jgi:hypothetical protein
MGTPAARQAFAMLVRIVSAPLDANSRASGSRSSRGGRSVRPPRRARPGGRPRARAGSSRRLRAAGRDSVARHSRRSSSYRCSRPGRLTSRARAAPADASAAVADTRPRRARRSAARAHEARRGEDGPAACRGRDSARPREVEHAGEVGDCLTDRLALVGGGVQPRDRIGDLLRRERIKRTPRRAPR